jgi:hypothetical protein
LPTHTNTFQLIFFPPLGTFRFLCDSDYCFRLSLRKSIYVSTTLI